MLKSFLICSFLYSLILVSMSYAEPSTPVTLLGFIGQSPRVDTVTGEDFILEAPYQAGGRSVTALEITPYQNLEQRVELYGLYAKITGTVAFGGKDGNLPILTVDKAHVIKDNFKHWLDYITKSKSFIPNHVILSYIPPDSMGVLATVLSSADPERVGEHTYRYTLKTGVKLKDALKVIYASPAIEYVQLDYLKKP